MSSISWRSLLIGLVVPSSMRPIAVILVVLCTGSSSVLAAQEMPPEEGARVRIKAPPSHPDWIEGTLLELPDGSLALTPEDSGNDSPLLLSRDQITGLEVYRGRKSAAGKGALIGLGTGAVVGIAVGFIGCEGWTEDCSFDADAYEVALIMGAVFGAVGAGIGSLIGLAAGTDDWEPVPVESLRLSVRPGVGGQLEFGLSVVF